MEKNYQSSVDIPMLCREFSFSKNHIINLFKKEFGKTPIAYLNDVRLNHAQQLLTATSQPIEEIAYRCGYRNYSHFYRQFMEKNRTSPEKFRQQKRLGK
jgi:transcriptional regulator GlxA family with amidase domain